MKYEKIYGEIVKAYVNKEIKNKYTSIVIGTADLHSNKLGITTSGHNCYFVDERKFPFDISKIIGKKQTEMFVKFYKQGESDEVEQVSMSISMMDYKDKTLVNIGSKWVDKRLLANFDKPTFKTNDNIYTPIYVYEYDILVGLVMPVNIKGEQSNE